MRMKERGIYLSISKLLICGMYKIALVHLRSMKNVVLLGLISSGSLTFISILCYKRPYKGFCHIIKKDSFGNIKKKKKILITRIA